MESAAIEQKVHGPPPFDVGGGPKKIVYLVGTVHVSDNSARKVRETISTVLPDFVCLELDLQRFKALQETMGGQEIERVGGASKNMHEEVMRSGAGPENRGPGAENPKPGTRGSQRDPAHRFAEGEPHAEDRLGEGGQFRYSGGASNAAGPEGGAAGVAKKSAAGKYTAAHTSPVEMLTLPGMLKWMQQRIGEEFGVMPGQEMAAAFETARGYGVRIALIDRPIQQTIARMWGSMGFKEKMKLFSYVVAAMGFLLLKPLFGKKRGDFSMFGGEKKIVEKRSGDEKITVKNVKRPHISMEKLEKGEGVVELMQVLEREFPAVHTTLVEERNSYMCNNIVGLLQKVNILVVVVGMGHVEGMKGLLEKRGVSGVEVRVV